MKFKLVFILFNVIIIFSFIFVFLMPLFVLGMDYSTQFWGQNWYLFVLFLVILGGLDGYFVLRWRFFRLLESENWPGLAAWLEHQVFDRGRLTDQNIRFLYRAWLIQGKLSESARLEALLREKKPALLPRYARMLGIRHLLDNNPADLVAYYGAFDQVKGPDAPWLRFGLALGHAGTGDPARAREVLKALALQDKNRIVQLVSLYMLQGAGGPEPGQAEPELEAARKAFVMALSRKDLEGQRNRRQDDLEILVLGKILDEAGEWVYSI